MSSPEAGPRGPSHACHLLAEPGGGPVCHVSDRLGGGDNGDMMGVGV